MCVRTFRLKRNDLSWGLITKADLDSLNLSVTNHLKERIEFLELDQVPDEVPFRFYTYFRFELLVFSLYWDYHFNALFFSDFYHKKVAGMRLNLAKFDLTKLSKLVAFA